MAADVWKAAPRDSIHGVLRTIVAKFLLETEWNTAIRVTLKIVPGVEAIPDVIAIRGKFKGIYPAAAPELCVEILSSEDALERAFEQARTYIEWGTDIVWMIYPEKQTAWSLSRGNAEPLCLSPSGSLRIGDSEINLVDLFAAVDEKLELN